MNLSIKFIDHVENETPERSPCALCRVSVRRVCGPEIFIDGSYAVVCRDCARKKVPYLEHMLAIYNHPGSLFCGSCGGYLSIFERSNEYTCKACRAGHA